MTLPGGEPTTDSRPPAHDARRDHLRWLLWAFYILSGVFVLVAIASTVDRTDGRVLPTAVAVAVVALTAALRCSASGWATLLPGQSAPVALRRCVYASQLGKYVPGGVVQAVGQVAIARRLGIPLGTAFPAYLVYAGHAAFASLAVGAVLVTQPSAVGARWAVGAGVLGAASLVTISRRLVELGFRLAGHVVPRLGRIGPLPSQATMARGYGWQVGFAVLQGSAFATLVRSLDSDVPFVAALGAHAVAFGLGLLAVPVPSGLLVREGLLIAILHPVAGAATIVTAAIVHRLAAIAAEVLMLVANRLVLRSPGGITPLVAEGDDHENCEGQDEVPRVAVALPPRAPAGGGATPARRPGPRRRLR